ncbi:hypothetical protein ECG_00239 [Echinococcus granulosus]|uniref:Expressed conserved protein n=1 Tax=Echinococcus granulosus TaxID=6210 RepID=U6JGY7_ECHGR|nr:hypothetical protein EGR_03431 [Echinococcus granulosus]EUB61617.1 hypothetical protein EGR_03431 [Echinococcus granulosus]KAH9285878.1 hypothetical protein ECG_00239 [Echinococcus granulosus]CDS22606.1 expressed conserved protein [Echinococcus granulosus]
MSIPCAPGWNDPPALVLGVSDSAASSRRPRPRVFHSVDGVGAAGSSVAGGVHSSIGSVPPIFPQVPPLSSGHPFVPQTPLHVPLMPQQQQQLPSPQSPPNNDSTSTLSRLSAQVNKVLSDSSLEIPGKEVILASISSLHLDISLNRLSTGAIELVKQFISFLELKDFKRAEDTLNVIKQQQEAVNWAVALHYLMYYGHLQALRR